MPKLTPRVTIACVSSFLMMGVAHAQFGRGSGWATTGGDAQRSSWVRTDAKISRDSLQKPGFQSLWKLKLNNQAMQLNSLTGAMTLEGYIGYRGFRTLAHLGGSANKVFAVDTDLGRLEWEKQLPFTATPGANSMACPGGMTAEVTRATASAIPTIPGARGGGGPRGGGGARSGVGDAGEGAITIAAAAANVGRGGGFPGGPGRGAPPRMLPNAVYAISGDGKLHSLLVSNGEPTEAPMDFMPANSNARGLTVVDNAAYAVSSEGCAGGASGLYALDLFEKKAASWKPAAGGIAGSLGPAFGPDGSLYVATTEGDLVHLDAKTLQPKETYSAGKPGFATTPVVFDFKGKALVAVGVKDGSIRLVDGAKEVSKSDPPAKGGDVSPAALSSWQDADGTRWILAPTASGIAAWKVVEQNGAPALQSGWVSQDMASPIAPMVINGVVFALATGEFRSADTKITAADRAKRSSPAVLYALDSSTGKELWNSGTDIQSWNHWSGLSVANGRVYIGTFDNTLYCYGIKK